MFAQKMSLEELSSAETNGLPAAIENAAKLTAEIIETLRGNKELEK
jgi:hypothetical protein